jgi:hypothetical protein
MSKFMQNKQRLRAPPADPEVDASELFLTPAEIAERLKIDGETVRRLFLKEPGAIVICFPRKGKRRYRTLRVPESVFRPVLARLSVS